MPRIVKTINGEALVKIQQEFLNEEAAQEGLHPENQKSDLLEFKVHNVTYKLKDAIKND